MEKVNRTYYITKELSDKLRDASFYLKKPQSEIVRNALELYLYSPEVCEAIRNDMKRLGGENRVC